MLTFCRRSRPTRLLLHVGCFFISSCGAENANKDIVRLAFLSQQSKFSTRSTNIFSSVVYENMLGHKDLVLTYFWLNTNTDHALAT